MANSVTMNMFLAELAHEHETMQKSTNYRRKTADMALELAQNVKSVFVFATLDNAYNALKSYFNTEDEERLVDVSKFLNMLYMHLNKALNMPENVRKQLEQRMKKSCKLSLVSC
ncbi:MAG: hypothetical protein KBT36_09475 [Kurthia sp.]|nr:hypothetical protein [Candidatus Kurthia equi]